MAGYTKVGNYVWRPTGENDRILVEEWIADDPDHAGRVAADFFLKSEPGHECYAVETPTGYVVFYLRLNTEEAANALRIDIQFRGTESLRTWRAKMDTADALIDGFGWLKTAALGAGFSRIVFTSIRGDLVKFAEKHLGFTRDGEELFYVVAPSLPQIAEEKTLHAQQQ